MRSGFQLFLATILTLGFVIPSHAQQSVLDSLGTNAPATNAPPAAPAAASAPTPTSNLNPVDSDKVSSTLEEALALIKQGQTEAALGKITSVLRIDPKNLDAYIMRGNIYTEKKDWDQALTSYQAALQIDPTNFTVKFNLAEIKFRQKQYDAARASFLALETEKDPDFSDLATYKVFLCDLYGGHEDIAAKQLAVFNQAGANPSYYFGNGAWSLFHHNTEEARGWLESGYHIYSPKKVFLYGSSLKELGYLPLPPPPAPAK